MLGFVPQPNLPNWFCLMVGRQLELENRLKDYWDTEILGSNDNCTVYEDGGGTSLPGAIGAV